MGFEPVVHCRECGEPLDVYAPIEERFCCDMCEHEFYKRDVVREIFFTSRAVD